MPATPPTPVASPDRPLLTHRWWAHPAVGIALVLWALLAGALGLGLWHLRQDTLQTQSQLLASVASSTADELQRGVQGVVLALQAAREDVDEGRAETAARLRRRTAVLPMVRDLWVLGPDGHVLAASTNEPPPPMADYLPGPLGMDEDSVAFSVPFRDSKHGDASVALAMRWWRGHFQGWVLGTMPAGAMLGAFPRAVPAHDMRLSVLRADGHLLGGTLREDPKSHGPEPRPVEELDGDSAEPVAFDDGSKRLVQRRRVEPLGLTIVLTRDARAVLSRWSDIRRLVGWGLLAIAATLALLLWWLLRAEAHSRRLQRRLSRVRTLEALGTLAGGVAHDFNNILAAVLGYGEMAREGAAAGSPLARQLDQVIAAALRGKGVVERILAFSRGTSRPSAVFALEPVVEQTLSLLAATLPAGVHIERQLQAPGACVRGDPAALFEAVMNLCTNARLAMPAQGVLGVRTQRRLLTEPRELSHGSVAAGRWVVLEVSDTGEGMSPVTMERLFEPFFTTRGQLGTGLGLAVVHGVVQDMGGAIDVQSRPRAGSRFSLWLPDVPASPTVDAVPAPATGEAPQGAGQAVLVVDDEAALVALAEESLAELGYEPVGFTDAEAALAEVTAQPGRFDLVLTDEVMPGMNGTTFAARLRTLRPDLPVLLMSGFGGAQLQQRAAAAGVRQVLAKPLERTHLARAIAAALGPPPPGNGV
ncbi:ATP-binding protein [Ideonella sp. YS5]|uniref:ATP-binding protein n=1 Tax=Ideonella sp. YS5 TaxID=3453714 RepID=UPI003EEC2EF4